MRRSMRTKAWLRPLAGLCLACVLFISHATAEQLDDSALFMDALAAFQRKDFLFSTEKLKQLEQLYPDSPLRDVSLLMLARANYRSGNNQDAATEVNRFLKEFGTNPLTASLEEELLILGKRQQAGAKLLPNKQLRTAALKVRNEQRALERAAALKAEQERLAQERVEQERLARLKAEAERREQERLAAIKATRDAIRFSVESAETVSVREAGTAVLVPFKLVNQGKDAEEFSVEAQLPAGIDGTVVQNNDIRQPVSTVLIAAGQSADLQLSFSMPAAQVDGSRLVVAANVRSTKFTDISKSRDIPITTAAPLLRTVARLQTSGPQPGQPLNYKITLLNIGSSQARSIDMNISLPAQLQLVDASDNGCQVSDEQHAVCSIAALEAGQMIERMMKVVVRQDAAEIPARGMVEVLQTALQLKERFPGAAFTVKRP